LISFGRKVVEGNIKQNNPGVSEVDLKIAVFERCFPNAFTEEEKNNIIDFFKRNFNNKN